MNCLNSIMLVVALMLPCMGLAADDAIEACLNSSKYKSRRLRGECLEKTGDVRAIAELHKMAMEITSIGVKGFADDDYWYLAGNAGEIAAWTDYKLLIEMTHSKDLFTQVFALEALKYLLIGLNSGPHEKLTERVARYRSSQGDIAQACKPYINSECNFLKRAANGCLKEAEAQPKTNDFPDPKKIRPLIGRPPTVHEQKGGYY